jgi:dynein heavy chain
VPYDVLLLRSQHDDNLPPTLVVLFQELEAFNKLMICMTATLSDLKRALKGEIGMNANLDDLAASLFNGLLPETWRKLTPQTEKKLGSWIGWFVRRFNQYDKWVKTGEPAVIWLSGLHIPESYTTALVQDCCRKKKWALDKSTLFTTVTTITDAREIKKKPEYGCYVTGLYLEGVSWDGKNNCIRSQQ